MAKADKENKKAKKLKKPKGQGQIAQIWQVMKMTVKFERVNLFYLLSSFFIPLIAGVLLAVFTDSGWIGIILWSLAGLMTGVMVSLIVLGRRAENAAFRQMEGQEGAVGAAVKNLRKSWRGAEMPIAVNPRTRDAVYRAVGKPGVILFVEGDASRIQKLIKDESRKVTRVIPNVTLEVIEVGDGEGKVRLHKLAKTINKMPKSMGKHEVITVHNRLESLTPASPIAIPKGIDPFKVRAQRPR